MSLLAVIDRELERRRDAGWTRVIVWTDEEEAAVDAARAEGRIRGNLIIRRIIEPSIVTSERVSAAPANIETAAARIAALRQRSAGAA